MEKRMEMVCSHGIMVKPTMDLGWITICMDKVSGHSQMDKKNQVFGKTVQELDGWMTKRILFKLVRQ